MAKSSHQSLSDFWSFKFIPLHRLAQGSQFIQATKRLLSNCPFPVDKREFNSSDWLLWHTFQQLVGLSLLPLCSGRLTDWVKVEDVHSPIYSVCGWLIGWNVYERGEIRSIHRWTDMNLSDLFVQQRQRGCFYFGSYSFHPLPRPSTAPIVVLCCVPIIKHVCHFIPDSGMGVRPSNPQVFLMIFLSHPDLEESNSYSGRL